MDGNRQRRAGLRLTDGQHAIADMLPPDAHHITAALRRVQYERKRQAWLGADRPARLELRDLRLGPSVESVRLWHLETDAQGRIVAHQFAVEAPPEEVTEGFQP